MTIPASVNCKNAFRLGLSSEISMFMYFRNSDALLNFGRSRIRRLLPLNPPLVGNIAVHESEFRQRAPTASEHNSGANSSSSVPGMSAFSTRHGVGFVPPQ